MGNLPTEIKLTRHAKQRLEERKNPDNYYNTKNLMKSSCKWYGKDDLIQNSQLYIHCLYVCRKAKNKMGYITDGNIEVLYDKKAKVAITIMEVKEKFLPITQYIKPEILEQNKRKKEDKKNKKLNDTLNLEYCSTINNKVIIDQHRNNIDYLEEKIMTFNELYAFLISEMFNYTSNLEYHSIKTALKNEQPYNIVYREKTTKPMTISELFGTDKKVYEEAIQ